MDAANIFAKNTADLKYDDLPREVVEITKLSILDCLGVMVAASTLSPETKVIADLIKEGGGTKESSIIAFGGKTVTYMAAFANGAMCHPLDYDDTDDAAIVHPTGQTLPAVLAVAEKEGTRGKDFITAVAIGIDLASRLGRALEKGLMGYGWLRPAIVGYFSSAAGVSKLLRLNAEKTANAFGLALNQAAGSLSSVGIAGSDFRAIRDGFSAKGGVLSALLSERGIKGDKNSIEGKYGLYNLYFQGLYDPAKLTANLGEKFAGVDVSFKPWPSCRNTHPFITATLDIIKEHNVTHEDVEWIRLSGGEFAQTLCEPLEVKRKPVSSIDAKVSLPFIIAVLLSRGNVKLADFTPSGLNDSLTLKVAEKVIWKSKKALSTDGIEPALVEIKMKDGKHYSKQINFAYGHPQNPMSENDIIAKFRDCVTYSAHPLPETTVNKVIQMVGELERIRDVSSIVQLLSPLQANDIVSGCQLS